MRWIDQFKHDLRTAGLYREGTELVWYGYTLVILGEHITHCDIVAKYLELWLRKNMPGQYHVTNVHSCALKITDVTSPNP